MTNEELGWIAGIIDGEGSILLSPGGRSRRKLRIMLPSTDLPILEELKRLFGGYIVFRKDKRKNVFEAWIWVLSTTATLELLHKCHHLLRCPGKAARAKYVLNGYKIAISKAEIETFENGFFHIEDKRKLRK